LVSVVEVREKDCGRKVECTLAFRSWRGIASTSCRLWSETTLIWPHLLRYCFDGRRPNPQLRLLEHEPCVQ
jgi:hypothetical protein